MSEPRTALVTGASGLVGRALVTELKAAGWEVKRLVRREVRDPEREIAWNPDADEIDAPALEGADAVIHLAGENIAGGRWTPERKQRIVESRVDGTQLLSEALASLDHKPEVLCAASAIGYYGDRPDEPVDENSRIGAGFLAETCVAWEQANKPAWEAGIRVVQVRVGLVLSRDGGLLGKLLPLFRFGLGSVLGSGEQMMSWISIDDLVRAFLFVLDNPEMHGAVNGVSPNPVSNREFTKTLGSIVRRPTFLPMPASVLRMAAGEMADEMLLAGAYVKPTRLLKAGFEFKLPGLEAALRDAISG